MKLQSSLYPLPTLLGGTFLWISQGRDAETVAGFVVGALTVTLFGHIGYRIYIRKHLSPWLERIDREIKQLDEIAE